MMEDYLFIVYTRKMDPITRLAREGGQRKKNVLHLITVSQDNKTLVDLFLEGHSTVDACQVALDKAAEAVSVLPVESKGKEVEVKVEIKRRNSVQGDWTLRKTIVQKGKLLAFSEVRKNG